MHQVAISYRCWRLKNLQGVEQAVSVVALVARKDSPSLDVLPRLGEFRASIATIMPGPQGQSEKAEVASKIIEDLVTLLFLTDAGHVHKGRIKYSTTDFLSVILSRGTSVLAEVGHSLHPPRSSNPESIDPETVAFATGHVDPRLFHGRLFKPETLEMLDGTPTWRELLESFKGFRWAADENGVKGTGDVPTITPAIFSRIHEHDMPSGNSDGSKKRKGVFYTPPIISRYICLRCITQYLASRAGIEADTLDDLVDRLDTSKLEDALLLLGQARVLDPSCGSGEFLVSMADVLFSLRARLASNLSSTKNIRARELKSNILSNNIFGAELSTEAIDIARKRLWLWMLSCDDDEPTEKPPFPSLEGNLITGNALIGWLDEDISDKEPIDPPTPSYATAKLSHLLGSKLRGDAGTEIDLEQYRPLHWRLAFRDLFGEDGGFDIVIGNPPYVFTRGRNFDDVELAYFSSWYFQGYSTITKGRARQSGKVNAFSLFIARSINLLKKGGILGFIVPNTLLRTTTNDIIRQFITTSAFVHEIVDLQDGVFEGVVASTIVLILEKGRAMKHGKRTVVKHCVEDLLSGKYQSHEVDQERFSLNLACIFDIHVDDQYAAMFNAMQKDTFPLEDACSEVIEGLVTRRGDDMFTTDPNLPNAKKLLRGKDIDRYKIEWHPGQYIIFEPTKLHRARPVDVHEAPVKLLAQRIGGGMYPLRVAYDDRQHYFFASINAIILKEEMNDANIEQEYKYILAILNSAVMNAYYLLNFSNKSSLTVNVSKTLLGSLPIKIAAPAKRQCIARIVDYLLFLNAYGNDETELLEYIDRELLDVIIFDLYICQEQEKDMLGMMLSSLHEIDPRDPDRRGTMVIIKESMARVKAGSDCTSWLRSTQESADFKAIKKLFEERVDGIVD